MSLAEPVLHGPSDSHRGMFVWRWLTPVTALSSASVGGGLSQPNWLMNIEVPIDYSRTDLGEHTQECAQGLGLSGDGVGLFTAANIRNSQGGECDGVTAYATVGISRPTWASDPEDTAAIWGASAPGTINPPGTINTVVQLPVGLEVSAAVNVVMTVTEAKTQALMEAGVPGTGTASDAVVVVWPTDAKREMFGGPRSPWGSRLAQATYETVLAGVARAWPI